MGLNTATLDAYFEKLAETDEIAIPIYPVQYCDEFPILNPVRMSDEEYIVNQLTIKSAAWDYEREYRALLLYGTNRPFYLPNDTVAEVILGLRMPKENRRQIVEVVRSKHPKATLLQAKKADGHFALDFESANL